MSTLQAIPTQHGIDILNSELKNTVTKYRLIGALTHDAPSNSLYSFYENTIETSYYDDNGVLTFILNLPIEQHFDEYLHQIHVLDSSHQSVIECSTPKVALPKGIGGMVTLKAAISGEAGEVIFKHSEFVTETELNELFLPQKENANNAASDVDIDTESKALKHVKLPQFWRALDKKFDSFNAGFSSGQEWNTYFDRLFNVDYTNSNPYPIQIYLVIYPNVSTVYGDVSLSINQKRVATYNFTHRPFIVQPTDLTISVIIPPNTEYRIELESPSEWNMSLWSELS